MTNNNFYNTLSFIVTIDERYCFSVVNIVMCYKT